VGINAILLLNKTSIKGADYEKVESRRVESDHFWREVVQIPGFMEGDKKQTVAWQPVVIKALAKVAFDLSKNDNLKEHNALIGSIRNGKLDLTNENPMWRWYRMTDEESSAPELAGLADYLPPVSKVNRDIGAHDSEGMMRFTKFHNDVFPLLGDMFRWKLGLTPRDHRSRAERKAEAEKAKRAETVASL
jgi:hypothetical protein